MSSMGGILPRTTPSSCVGAQHCIRFLTLQQGLPAPSTCPGICQITTNMSYRQEQHTHVMEHRVHLQGPVISAELSMCMQATGRTYLLLVDARNTLKLQLPAATEKAVDDLVAAVPRVCALRLGIS